MYLSTNRSCHEVVERLRCTDRPHGLLQDAMALSHLLESQRRDRAIKGKVGKATTAIEKIFKAQAAVVEKGLQSYHTEHYRQVSPSSLYMESVYSTMSSTLKSLMKKAFGKTSKEMTAALTGMAEDGLELGAKDFFSDQPKDLVQGISFDLSSPAAMAHIKAHGAEMVKAIDDTTREEMLGVLERMAAKGESPQAIAREIVSRWKGFAIKKPQLHIRNRAHLVAVTELGNGYEQGRLLAAREMEDEGLPMMKSWLTVGDDRVSEGCQDNANDGWIDLGKKFSSGHDSPLRFPGCRCTALYRRKSKGVPKGRRSR